MNNVVILRNVSIKDDIGFIYRMYADKRMQALISGRVTIKSKEDFREWFLFQLHNYFHEFRVIEMSKEIIGFCYSYAFNDGVLKTALCIDYPYQKRGLGAAAGLLFLDMLFREYALRKIYSDVYSYNEASLSMHKSGGFSLEGILKDYRYYNGSYHDLNIFSVTREQFYKLHGNTIRRLQ